MKKIRFIDIDKELNIGESQVFSGSVGLKTYVGKTSEGHAVLQDGNDFLTVDEFKWNTWNFTKKFEPQFLTKFISEEEALRVTTDLTDGKICFSDQESNEHCYRLNLSIERIYKKPGGVYVS